MMEIKKILCLLLALATVLPLVGCMAEVPTVVEGTKGVIKEETGSIEDMKLRDNPLLYKGHDPAKIVTMYLTVSTGNSSENTNHTWQEVNSYSAYYYDELGIDRYKVAGLLQVGDENGPVAGMLGYGQLSPNCTVQIRGQTSSRNSQKNYKIAVKDNKGEWNGQKTIALNKHETDGLRFRNKLAYDLMAGIEQMMSLRTNFVHLYVRDTTEGGSGEFVDYGLYTQVEQLNKTALKAHGLDKNGHLYKINYFEFFRDEDVIKLKDDPSYDLKKFEEKLEIKGSDDHSKLIGMLDALNDYSHSAEEILDTYFDIENMAYWMAFHILMGNLDTQSRNVYIYSPLNSNKWYFYSWDNDFMLGQSEKKLVKRVDGGEWETGVSNYWGNLLFQRALKTEKFRNALNAAVEDLREYISPERLSAMSHMYSDIIKPYLYKMPDIRNAPLTEDQYDMIVAGLVDEYDSHYRSYKDSFKKPMPFYVMMPEIKNGKLYFRWDSSFDFDSETITYTFDLARDYDFNEVVFHSEDLFIPEAITDLLPEGQYFIRVRARNESGEEQYGFDYYNAAMGKVYGAKCFYVLKDGTLLEDIHVVE